MGKTARRVSDPSSPTSPYLYYESQLATSEITTAINIAPVSAAATNATIDVLSIDSLSPELYNHSLLATLTQSPTEGSSQIKNVNNNKTLSLPSSTTIKSVTSTQETTTTKATTSTVTAKAKTNSSMYQQSSPAPSTMPAQSHVTTTLAFNNSDTTNSTLLKREKLRMEFYATYDVMTGIRIAATLGGFFVLMVFLVVYKSRSHTNKGLDDPKVKAAATAVVEEEEERELQEAIEKTAFSLYQEEMDFVPPIEMRLQRDRMLSLGNVSCPPMILNPNMRFSSIGGYSSLLDPSRRFSESSRLRRQSTSDSSRVLSAYHLNDNYNNQNENFFNESDGEEADDEFEQFTTTAEIANTQSFLSVPMGQDSRRSSGMTCCSTESSFLERRCSAITLGLSSLPTISRSSSRRASRVEWEPELQYGPGIHIIEPTPKSSPNPSERYTHDKMKVERIKLKHRYDDNSIDSITEYPDEANNCNDDYAVNLTTTNNNNYNNNSTHQSLESSCNNSNSNNNMNINLAAITTNNNNNTTTDLIRRAPLASLSSFKMSSAEFQDFDIYQKSGSDSVFVESCADTDEDMDQFSTDSDEISLIQTPPPEENSIEQQQIFSINLDDSSLFKICDPRGASVSVVNIETDILSRKFIDDSNQLSHIEIIPKQQHQEQLQQQQQQQQPPQLTQIYKSNSANLFDIERHQQNDTMKKRPASSGCLFSSNFNNAFTNESSVSFNNDNNSSSRSNITVLRASTPDWGGGATANSNNDSNSNSYKNHSCSNQSNECIQINVIDSDVASSHTLPTTTIHSSTPQSSTSNNNNNNNIINNNNSSSVILELPVITAQIESSSSSNQIDPCIPGTSSRKWSKETLF